MNVHLIRKDTIDAYTKKNALGRTGFNEWCAKLKYAD